MALLASRCHSSVLISRLLARTSLLTQIPDRGAIVRSKQFPEYSLIYDLPQIKTACRINRMKMHATVLYGCGLPLFFAMKPYLDYYLIPQVFDSFTFFGGMIVVFLHSIGFIFNNTIGFVYITDDEKSIRFSYVGYWGQRSNTDASIGEICPLSDPSDKSSDPWYYKVRLTSSKETLKLFPTAGKILDHRIFNLVFGRAHA